MCEHAPAAPGVQVGGIRRIIVPVELGYPNNDMNALGPRPLTFSVRVVSAVCPNSACAPTLAATRCRADVGMLGGARASARWTLCCETRG